MRKVSAVAQDTWNLFLAQCDPALAAWETRTSARFPGFVIVTFLREETWQAAKLFGGFLAIPAPWIRIEKLSDEIRAAMGQPDDEHMTVGDYLMDLLGRDIFRD